jgi:hypothetical protein
VSGLFVIYRSTGPDRFPRRPPYFDKLLCLRSFLLSFRHVGGERRLLFLNDGPVPDDRVALMRQWGSVIELPGLGNGPSFRRAVESALAMPDDTIAYFAEDDYLYLEPALGRVMGVFAAVPAADYVTPYDHLDRYLRTDDARGGMSRVIVAAGQHWRTVDSTTMTFAVRVARLLRDAWVVRLATAPKKRPKDHLMWRLIQGQKHFFWKFPKRMLLGPVPSLATHMDTKGLAPAVDWEAAARAAALSPLE